MRSDVVHGSRTHPTRGANATSRIRSRGSRPAPGGTLVLFGLIAGTGATSALDNSLVAQLVCCTQTGTRRSTAPSSGTTTGADRVMTADETPDDRLDRAFMALADPVRRAIVARLSRGPATVRELAEPFAITQQAISRHVGVLEAAGLVTRTREAQRRPAHLQAATLEALTSWIDTHRRVLEEQYRRLDAVIEDLQARDRTPPPPEGADRPKDTP